MDRFLPLFNEKAKKKFSGVVEKIHDGRLDSEMNFEDFS